MVQPSGRPTLPALNNPSLVGRPNLVPTGPTGIRSTGPQPLLTNPNPSVTSTAKKPATGTTARSAYSAYPPAPVTALAAISAVRPDLSPATLAVYAYSQRNASHPWWDPWGPRRGYYGYGGYGYGGYGYGGYGYGWGGIGWAPYGINPFWFGPGFGIGIGYSSGPWSFGFGWGGSFAYSPAIAYVPVYVEQPAVVVPGNPPLLPQGGPELPPPAAAQPEKPADEANVDFAARGQELFLNGKYPDAVKTLRHAVLDDPKNGPLLALTGEALWAAGNYDEAAGALQQSLLATPETDWVGVANRAARLTPTESVTALAKALEKGEQPAMRFLAGYQSFGAGKYDEAAAHLEYVLKKAPEDQVAKKLRDQAVKLAGGK